MKHIMLCGALLWQVCGSAQKVIDVNKSQGFDANTFYSVGGAPFVNAKFVRLTSGTPFFKDEWMKASGKAANGTAYGGGVVKLNLYDNEIVFLDAAGNEMIATTPLKEITLTDTINNVSFHFDNTLPLSVKGKKRWLQRLAVGKVGLYKAFDKVISENASYGTATTDQTMNTVELFYIFQNNEMKQVRKPKDLINLLSDKQADLNAYFNKKEFPKGKAEQELVALVTYYNSLQ